MAEFTDKEMQMYLDMLQNADTTYPSNLFEEKPLELSWEDANYQEAGVKNILGSLLQLTRNVPKWFKSGSKGSARESLKNLKKDELIDMIAPPKKGFWESTKDYVKEIPKKAWEGTKESIDPRVHPIRKGIKAGLMGYQGLLTDEGITSPLTAIPIPLPGIGPTPLSSISGLHNLISDIGGTEVAQEGIAKTADVVNAISNIAGAGDILPSGEELQQVMGVEPQDTTKQKLLIDNPAVTNMIDSLMNKRDYANPRLKQLYKDNGDEGVQMFLDKYLEGDSTLGMKLKPLWF